MSIEVTYRKILLHDWLKERLTGGVSVSAFSIREEVERLLEDMDLSVPQFIAADYYTADSEISSAAKHSSTFSLVKQDLRALYKEMISLTKVSTQAIERWRLEADSVEKRLVDLEDRIENLLLLTQDTEGYHSILIDNFTDTALTDMSLSTAQLDLQGSTIQMAPSGAGSVRVFLNDLNLAKDLSFKVRTTVDHVSRADAVGSDLRDPFRQESKSWWTSIGMKSARPVSCELTVRLSSAGSVPISRIVMELHDSSESGPVNVTPLYSTDNQTYNQLPSNTFTQEVRTSAVFSFSSVDAQWVKFILTKQGPDPSAGADFFFYEFGFKEISFYNEGFEEDTVQIFVSEPLYVVGDDGEPLEFEKLTLETCERIETDTSIDYFVTTALVEDDIDTNFDSDTVLWVPISPVNRANPKYLQILDVGDVTETIIGDTETVGISYNPTASDSKLINPASPFQLLSKDSTSGAVRDDEVNAATGPIVRYSFKNTNDRILNYQIKDTTYTGSEDSEDALLINEANLAIFRNIGEQGLETTDASTKVRDVQRGWRFEDPYYTCVIEVQNAQGISIDVGDKAIIVDDVSYTNRVDEMVLTGKTAVADGLHRVRVHKSNWREVDPSITYVGTGDQTADDLVYLGELKIADPLYPFNHKLLIEGYDYDSGYEGEKIYLGADLFAEVLLRQISVFDLMNSVAVDNYDLYALDRDAPNSHEGPTDENNPTRVFVVKVDENNPDFRNERFMIRFTQINQPQKYLRLRADLSTEDATVSPALHSYKIKLGEV